MVSCADLMHFGNKQKKNNVVGYRNCNYQYQYPHRVSARFYCLYITVSFSILAAFYLGHSDYVLFGTITVDSYVIYYIYNICFDFEFMNSTLYSVEMMTNGQMNVFFW